MSSRASDPYRFLHQDKWIYAECTDPILDTYNQIESIVIEANGGCIHLEKFTGHSALHLRSGKLKALGGGINTNNTFRYLRDLPRHPAISASQLQN